jgi:glycosyltransferase involved in cell wall biosynthesis
MKNSNNRIALFCGIPVIAKYQERTYIRPIFWRVGLLAKGLIEQGYDVKLYAPSYNYYFEEKIAEVEGIKVIHIGHANLPYSPLINGKPSLIIYLKEIFRSLKRAKREIDYFKPEVVHVFTTFLYSIITGLFLKLCGYRVFIDVDDAINGQMEYNKYARIFIILQKIVDYIFPRMFDSVTVCSEFLFNKIRKNVKIIPNMVDRDFFTRDKKKETKDICVVMVGSIDGIQGHEFIIRYVIPEVLNQCDNVRFIFVGEGKLLDRMKTLTKELKLEDKVKFLGYLSHNDVADVLAYCDIGLLPLKNDTVNFARYPLKMLEYQASKVVVIASSVGEARRHIKHLSTGYLVPPDDFKGFAKAIIFLVRENNIRIKIAEKAYNDIIKYDFRQIVPEWLKVWNLKN